MKKATLLALLVCGCSTPPPPDKATPTPESQAVVVAPASRQELDGNLRLTGQVKATESGSVILTAPLDGVALRPLVKVGSSVIAEQPLVEMNSVYGLTSLQILERLEKEQDDVVEARGRLSEALTHETEAQTSLGAAQSKVASLRADLRQAEAELQFAKSDVSRKRELVEDGITSRVELEEARTRLSKAEAVAQAATQELSIARGQVPLFQRNISQYRQAVRLAQESVNLSESNYERNRAVLSQAQLVGTDLPADLTALRLGGSKPSGAAEASNFFVRAPISGVVTKLSVTRGQRVQSGAEIGQVQELSQVYVDANAFEADVASLKVGMPLQVTSNGRTYRGRLDYIGRQVDPQTRTIPVRSLIHNPQGGLRPDTFVEVIVDLPGGPGLTVPKSAVLSLGSEQFVLVEGGPGRYERRPVRTGVESGAQVQITKGLKEGEKVVTQGGLLLEAREK
ncbi:hypothetical protein ABS71_11625 [bacterium SCN 62-11]|nr:efflux RND transporter periplasmic adaptor subunit [Candidatus Eremiobacteraeota bacterium]ODT66549.1 MAG: hypothetical protein ABS71_11625 [bacterium SCN 62-11]